MKTISLHQPMASMIVLGLKPIETRGHDRLRSLSRLEEDVAIHATRKWESAYVRMIRSYLMLDSYPRVWKALSVVSLWPRGKVIGVARCTAFRELTAEDSPWALCPCAPFNGEPLYGLFFERPRTIGAHRAGGIRARGHQGVWNWQPPEDLESLLVPAPYRRTPAAATAKPEQRRWWMED